MNTPAPYKKNHGFPLIELTLVLMVMLALAATGIHFLGGMKDWNKGKEAAEKLRTVYAAQRAYLADYPTVKVSRLTANKIKYYLPTGETAIPTITGLDGVERTIKVNVSPPVITGNYDPSGATDAGLWDVGKY
jgi:type II secretory pathway pseudopilin PulG